MTKPVDNAAAKKKVHVMIVDDSAVIRGMTTQALQQDATINIVASVADGEMALNALKQNTVDVVILDIEMPKMDGLTALPLLLALQPKLKIIMASSLTLKGADVSMKALSLGAADCMAKPSSVRDKDATIDYFKELAAKVKSLGGITLDASWREVVPPKPSASKAASAVPAGINKPNLSAGPIYPRTPPRALAIASSTGGPQALLNVFKSLNNRLMNIPIFITQHMPASFTTILAGNIASTLGRDCHEGIDGEIVKPGVVYLAPGNYHMIPKRKGGDIVITLTQDPPVNFCRPAADPMMEALVAIYGKEILLGVLTGMGQDGLVGAKMLVDQGGLVVAQDEESSVVWGMPRAIIDANIHSAELPLSGFANYFIRAFGEK